MPKPKAMIDYSRCHPEKCDAGVCAAAAKCSFGVLRQDVPWEVPYTLQDFVLAVADAVRPALLRQLRRYRQGNK